jgi:hypothetical protein
VGEFVVVGLCVGSLNGWTVGEDVGVAIGDEVGEWAVVDGLCEGL